MVSRPRQLPEFLLTVTQIERLKKIDMKDMTLNGDQSGLTRRQLLGLATLTTAGLAAASVGVPQAKAVPKAGEQHEPIEDFKHDLEGSECWVGEGAVRRRNRPSNSCR